MEYVSGIMSIHTNAGIDSEKSSKLTFLICSAISNPTMIKAGAVAADGIERNSGEKNIAITKQPPTTRAVKPERPPWATPAALSTYVVVVEVPKRAPKVVAMESAMNACFTL